MARPTTNTSKVASAKRKTKEHKEESKKVNYDDEYRALSGYHCRGNPRYFCYCYLVAHEHYLLVYQTQPELVNTTDHRNHPNDIEKRTVTPRL